MSGKPKTLHQEIIQILTEQDPRIKTSGFMKELRSRCGVFSRIAEDGDELRASRPDAYLIDEDRRIVFVIEVEVSHPLDEDALCRYWDLLWAIDDDHWEFRLITVDRRGIGTLIDTMVLAFHPDGRNPTNLVPASQETFSVAHDTWNRWLTKHLVAFDEGAHHKIDDLTADHPQRMLEFLTGKGPGGIWQVSSGRFVLPREDARLVRQCG